MTRGSYQKAQMAYFKKKGKARRATREVVLLIHLPRKKRIKVGRGSYRT
jgi:hypothetical protein